MSAAITIFSTAIERIEREGAVWLTFLNDEGPERRSPVARIVMTKAAFDAWRKQIDSGAASRLCGTGLCPLTQPIFTMQ